MKMLIALSTVLLAGTAAPALAKDGEDKNKVICKTYKETGSRLGGKRICMTENQWAEHRRLTKEAVDRAQTNQVNKSGS